VAYLPPTRGTRQCPVSGGVEGAEAGTLSIMVGGEERDAANAWAVLSACGNPVHPGPLGSGQVAKAGIARKLPSELLARATNPT
jgi:3-hydroxyisobutyrate dehydrogenase-like beta-hydroxyacid dehydrogenase